MTINDTRFGPQDTPPRDQAGTSTAQQVGHEPDHPSAQQGTDHGGHAGHHWMMLMCAPMLVIAVALVATGTAGVGTIVVALGCAVMMAVMMRGMGGHGRGGGV